MSDLTDEKVNNWKEIVNLLKLLEDNAPSHKSLIALQKIHT